MAVFELDKIEKQFNSSPLFYQRYVDDIFAVFNTKENALIFSDQIDILHPDLKYTSYKF